MPKNPWTLAAVWLLLGASCLDILAASNEVLQPALHYTVKAWGPEEGLPQSSVFALTQTRDGYLWLGTLNGLARFDGRQFRNFDQSTTPGLPSSRIFHLFEDSQGNLWIGTEAAGVALAKTNGQIVSLDIGRGAREKRLTAACEDSSGAVWLYTANGELGRYQNGRVDVWNAGTDRPSSCRALIAEKSGPLWLGMDWGLFALGSTASHGSTALPVEYAVPVRGKLDFLLASQRGGHWRLVDGRIQKWTTNRLERDFGPYPWTNVQVTAACEDRQGNLVVGTYGDGIYWFDAEGRFSRLSSEEGLSHNSILALALDREGSLWVGSNGGGLNRVKRQVFDAPEASRGSTVQSVCEDGQGGLWVGYNGDRVDHWSGSLTQQFSLVGYLNPSVKAVLVDRDQRVWVGMWDTPGSHLFQLQDGRFRQVAGLPNQNNISALYQDRNGLLWAGTQGGLARWDGRDWKAFSTRDTNGLSSDEVTAIADDAEGNLWIGTRGGGLNRLRDGRFIAFHKADGLPSEDISSLLMDDQGVLWIGTSGGLARLHAGKWTRYTMREGLVSNSVGYLVADGQGNLWIGSNAGLMRVTRKELNDYAEGLTNVINCRAYGGADGLPARECTYGSQPGAWRTRDGRLWFPTTKGLASVNPAQLQPNTNPPPVVIESVLIEGHEQNTNGLRGARSRIVTVPAGKKRLEIRYTSLNLAAPDQTRFKYRMEGHETWNDDAGNARVAGYSNLLPGHYLFQVIACNEDGVWNETGDELTVIVERPYWMTWWFRSAVAAVLLVTVIGVVHYLSTQKLQRQLERLRQQEALERERARIARDIHDQLGASLTQVSLLGELVESDKQFPDEVEAHARQISQTARETTRALDEIVWTVNPSNDTLEGLINYVCKYAQDYLAVAGIRYRFDVPAQLPAGPIPPEVRHNIFLASKEAVTNVVRHAKASAVWIRLRLEPTRFTLEIEDNGCGPGGKEESAAKTRNGLRNMRKRMEDVGGSFSMGPGAEGGTLVRLTVPAGKR